MKIIISLLISLLIAAPAMAQVSVETYSNGSKKAEGKILNGERDGIWYEFNLKGLKIAEANYVNGVKEGKYTECIRTVKSCLKAILKMAGSTAW